MTIPGIIELETGRTVMLEASDVDANSIIRLMEALGVAYPTKRRIYLFLDDARYYYARSVRDWLQRQGCRIKMRFIQTY